MLQGAQAYLGYLCQPSYSKTGDGGLINHLYLQTRPAQSTLKCVAFITGRTVTLTLHGYRNLSSPGSFSRSLQSSVPCQLCVVLEIPTWGQIRVGKPAIADDNAHAANLKVISSIIIMCKRFISGSFPMPLTLFFLR